MRTVADVVIIGAGATGCSIAFHLARLKRTRVIVVEKGSLASGMTKRSGGMIRLSYPWESEARLALASLGYFQNWKELVGSGCGFTRTGFVTVAQGETQAAQLEHQVAMLRRIGAKAEILSREQLGELQPAAHVDDVTLAAYEPESGYADPIAATQSLAARAKKLGVSFHTGTFAKRVLVERGRVFGVDTTTGEIETMSVVIAAGPWSDRLLKPLGVKIGIRSERAQVAFFERPAELKAGHAAFMDSITGVYFRPHTFGLTLGGLTEWQSDAKPNPDQFEDTVDQAYVQDVHRRIVARVPAMVNARYVRGHAGIYDTSPDGHAVLDRVPGIHGLVVAAGFSGSGSALAPAVGACIAELVTEGAASTVDLSPFGFARFGLEEC
ncbi:MAG: FAD-binding oxidoreductase [Chloroflexi bacterium]|nr:FAD-binding oxidoreductase [Chloroflexota bacterium]